MTKFTEKIRMKGQGEEDLYFSRRDQELIKAMHDKELAKALAVKGKKEKKTARLLEQDYQKVTKTYRNKPYKLPQAYRDLLNKLLIVFHVNTNKKRK